MDAEIIKNLFTYHKIETVKSIDKIEIGFSNEVYSIDDQYMLKVCKDHTNEKRFEIEAFCYAYFKNKIPIPELIVYDESKKICKWNYLIYSKIQGTNLYAKWHLLKESERKEIVREICEILKTINSSSTEEFNRQFGQETPLNWQEKILAKINNSLKEIELKEILDRESISAIQEYVNENKHVLIPQDISLVYWDIHFDNVIIKDQKLVGIIDFERTELCSIDFVLDIVKRMVDYPKKYISEDFEKFARTEDYQDLLLWYKEYYPKLFNFPFLETRLNLYSLEHDLATLIGWPNYDELKKIIMKTIN